MQTTKPLKAVPPEAGPLHTQDQAAKLVVMMHIAEIVRNGEAECKHLDSGHIELRMATGEVFHLLDDVIVRLGERAPRAGKIPTGRRRLRAVAHARHAHER